MAYFVLQEKRITLTVGFCLPCLIIGETNSSGEEIRESNASINEPLSANKKPSGTTETGKKCLIKISSRHSIS